MDEVEYMIVNALGHLNVVKAIDEKTQDKPQWRLHSVVTTGLKVIEHPLHPGAKEAIMTFMVIFERPHLGYQA